MGKVTISKTLRYNPYSSLTSRKGSKITPLAIACYIVAYYRGIFLPKNFTSQTGGLFSLARGKEKEVNKFIDFIQYHQHCTSMIFEVVEDFRSVEIYHLDTQVDLIRLSLMLKELPHSLGTIKRWKLYAENDNANKRSKPFQLMGVEQWGPGYLLVVPTKESYSQLIPTKFPLVTPPSPAISLPSYLSSLATVEVPDSLDESCCRLCMRAILALDDKLCLFCVIGNNRKLTPIANILVAIKCICHYAETINLKATLAQVKRYVPQFGTKELRQLINFLFAANLLLVDATNENRPYQTTWTPEVSGIKCHKGVLNPLQPYMVSYNIEGMGVHERVINVVFEGDDFLSLSNWIEQFSLVFYKVTKSKI